MNLIPNYFLASRALTVFFPELTSRQVYIMSCFCLGVPVNHISIDLGIKQESVSRQLYRVIGLLGCGDFNGLKSVFISRVFFAVILKLQ